MSQRISSGVHVIRARNDVSVHFAGHLNITSENRRSVQAAVKRLKCSVCGKVAKKEVSGIDKPHGRQGAARGCTLRDNLVSAAGRPDAATLYPGSAPQRRHL